LGDYVRRAKRAGFTTWPLPDDVNDDALEALLFPRVPPTSVPRALPDWAKVHLELARKHVTLMLLFEEYRERHPDGYGYSQFCSLYRTFAKKVDVSMRFTHKAGERMWVDYAGSTLPIWDEALENVVMNAQVFVSALGVSSLIYAEVSPSQELVHWTSSHEHAFAYYGGVAELTIPDNLRSGVTKRPLRTTRERDVSGDGRTLRHSNSAREVAQAQGQSQGRGQRADSEPMDSGGPAQSPLHVN
jgi:transposase